MNPQTFRGSWDEGATRGRGQWVGVQVGGGVRPSFDALMGGRQGQRPTACFLLGGRRKPMTPGASPGRAPTVRAQGGLSPDER